MILLLFMCVFATTVRGENVKVWYPNTNYWNTENWDLKRIPCRSDLVSFPPNSEIAVSLNPGTTALRELVLPRSGELVLAHEGQLLVTGSIGASLAGCPGQELLFTGGDERAWLDTMSWRDDEGREWPGGEDSPVPDVEKVPCPTDLVVFPPGSTFKVQLPDVPVTVGALQIQGVNTPALTFQRLVQSGSTGYYLFKGNAEQLQVSGVTCEDPLGCVCTQHQFSETMEALCTIEKLRCQQPPPCEDPIQPAGHCCKICGGLLVLKMNPSKFSRSSVMSRLQSSYAGVLTHLSRVDADHLQLVIREKSPYIGQSTTAARKLATELKDESGVLLIKLDVSGDPLTSLGSTWTIVFMTLLVVLVLLGVGFLLLTAFRTYGSGMRFPITEIPSFHFKRFENRSVSIDGEVAIAKNAADMGQSSGAKAFDNPMFDKPTTSSDVNIGTLTRPKVKGRTVTMENPTYKVLQEAANQDGEEESQVNDVFTTPPAAKYSALHDEE